jgi:hypothetical protein
MRLPRVRFTIKSFMATLAVATILIVAVGIPVGTWLRFREGYSYAAEYHEEQELAQRKTVDDLASLRSRGLDKDPLFPICDNLARRRLAFHVAMGRKWRKARANPWADVSDDPEGPTDDRIVKKFELGPAKYMTDDVQYFVPPTGADLTGASQSEKE